MVKTTRLSDAAASARSESCRRSVPVRAFCYGLLALTFLPLPTHAQTVPNGGFETPVISGYQFQPTGASWTFNSGTGISANNSLYTSGNNPAPEGKQVAFITGGASIQQTFSGFAKGGSYQITFEAATYETGPGSIFQVEMQDGANHYVIGDYTMLSAPGYHSFTTAPFSMTGVSGTLSFTNITSPDGGLAFIDQVVVRAVQPSGALTAAPGNLPVIGSGPNTAVVADFNNDGIPDIATANSFSSTVTVLLGTGTGGFTPAPGSPFAVGTSPVFIAVGDFSGSGWLDIVTANSGSGDVTLLFGNGTGTFGGPTGFATGITPHSLLVADFNGDGKQDLIVTDGRGGNAVEFFGNGARGLTLQSTTLFAARAAFPALAAMDFNADGKLDIAVLDAGSNTVTVWLGNGSGGFSAASASANVGSGASAIAAGDLNHDGNPDIAVANSGNNNVTVLLGNGNGTFTAATGSPFAVGTDPLSVVIADFDGDGVLDIATGNHSSGELSVLLGDGTGAFTPAFGSPFFSGSGPWFIAAGDFNLDGRMDIATVTNTNNIAVLLGALASDQAALIPSTSSGSVTSSYVGTPVTLTLTVTPAATDFTAPTGTATFLDGTKTLGIAGTNTSPWQFNAANLALGGHTFTATYGGDAGHAPLSTTAAITVIPQLPQTITLSGLPSSAVYNSQFTASATATSGDAVVFTSSGGCTNSGPTYTMTSSTVACSVIANQPGDFKYLAAPAVVRSVTAALAPQTITISGVPVSATYSSTFTVSATIGGSGNPLVLTSSGSCFNDGGATYFMTIGTGTCFVGATQAGNSNYLDAPRVSLSVAATGYPQTVSFGASSGLAFVGETMLVNAVGGELPSDPFRFSPVTSFTSLTPGICSAVASNVTLRAAGTCSISATAPANDYYTAGSVTQSFTVLQPKPSEAFVVAVADNIDFGFSGFYFDPSKATNEGADFLNISNPFAVAAGDFDGDGKPDIVTANFGTSNVSVFLGGSSYAESISAVGNEPYSIAVGDFNQDGNLDVVTANYGGGDVTVLLGNGRGGFAPGSSFPIGSSGLFVTVADFNGDGKLDIAAANNLGGVAVLLGNGSGGFAPAAGSPFYAGSGMESLAVGDFNGDGKLDIAVADFYTSSVVLLQGDGSGGFAALTASSVFPVGGNPSAVTVGDFNGDGKLDVVTANYTNSGSNITVLMGDGNGGFAPRNTFAVGNAPYSVAVGDFNGDGKLDIVTENLGDDTVSLLLGDGNGGFASAVNTFVGITSGTGMPGSMALGDFNGDGRLDIWLANRNFDLQRGLPGDLTLVLGSTAATSTTLSVTPSLSPAYGTPITLTAAVTPAAGSFGAVPTGTVTFYDGAAVLGTASTSPYQIVVSTLSFGTHNLSAAYGGDTQNAPSTSGTVSMIVQVTQSVTFGGLSGLPFVGQTMVTSAQTSSGLPATFSSTTASVCRISGSSILILAAGTCTIQASVAPNDFYSNLATASQSFTTTAPLPSGSFVEAGGKTFSTGEFFDFLAVGDFNGDGKPDVAATIGGASYVRILLGDGSGGFVAGNTFGVGNNPSSIATGDFNGDGKLDMVMPNQGSNNVTVLLGDGNGGVAATNSFTVNKPSSVAVGDFNGDGRLDIAVANGGDLTLTVLLGNGSGGFIAESPLAVGTSPNSVVVGDFNGDGKLDILLANDNSSSSNATVLLGNGSGGFVAGTPFPVGTSPYFLTMGDFNGDGKPDIVTLSATSGIVTVLLGDGGGGFASTGNPIAARSFATAITAGDFDGDGKLDLVTANGTANNVTVMLGDGSGGFGVQRTFAAGNDPSSVMVGDFNGDGRLDIVTTNEGSSSASGVTVLLGNSSAVTSTRLSTTAPSGIVYGASVPLTAVVSQTTPALEGAPTGSVAFLDGSTTLGTVANNPYVLTPAALGAGPHTLTAVYNGDKQNAPSTSSPIVITVTQAPQTITFSLNAPASAGFLTSFTVAASSSSGLAPVFTSSGGCTNNGDNYTMTSGTTACSVIVNQAGNANYAAAVQIIQTVSALKVNPVISWTAPAAVNSGAPLSSGQLDATANVPGTFAYTPAAGTVLPIGNGQVLSVIFTPTDAVDYVAAAASTAINVIAPVTPAQLAVAKVLSRGGGSVSVQITLSNTGGSAAGNVIISAVKVGSLTASPLPQVLGTIGAGSSAQAFVSVPDTVGASGAASSLTISGTYTGGVFSLSGRITLP